MVTWQLELPVQSEENLVEALVQFARQQAVIHEDLIFNYKYINFVVTF